MCPTRLHRLNWALADDDRWPIAWPRSTSFLEYVTGEVLPPEPAARYERYLVLQRDLDPDHWHFWWVAAWWAETKPVFLDRILLE